ncbi:hypothetical protein [Cyanobium sp. ATX 6F1]|uniref:hypothetical protein n=1 Tax=unclassified Cyanobium TaxID=2627006 RepID=UPI0020CE2B96|nr:hypothetical protein [Cyanobium sp. ATX 6F1]MCP9915818.1 hypothetical protein [Cyanobium sp. ATX 6F1]
MSMSLESPLPSHYRSKQEFLASLSPWRRLLANLNWHPTIEKRIQLYALEQKAIEREQRMQRLENEIAQIESEIVQIESENARLAAINSRLERFEREHLSGSTPLLSTGDSSNS